ncbi:hypothetical protein [Sinosporangium album]|uniref:hypothetical protein n=1 Tax=Sinosporangium album TaxID=504805 RepID=UPI00115F9A6D|nr:hypothetical protein [Sinosporangium album]
MWIDVAGLLQSETKVWLFQGLSADVVYTIPEESIQALKWDKQALMAFEREIRLSDMEAA